MPKINKPMDIPELNVQPPIMGKINLSDDMQQSLALLTAYCDNKRLLVRATESGVLNVASPRLLDIIHVPAVGGDYIYRGGDIPCTEVMIMGHPDNTGLVWARTNVQADTDNSWPLAKTDVVGFTVNNMNQLHLRIVVTGEIAIVAYTR